MDSNKLKTLLVIIIAAFGAIFLGVSAATAQMEAIAWEGGVLCFVLLLALGRHVWVLIPLSLCLSGGLNFLPGSPATWYIATPIVVGFMLLRFLSRSRDFIWRWTWMETLVLLNLLLLIQTYLRNPTGLLIFGSSGGMIGGKAYLDFLIATVGFFVLGAVRTEWKTVRIVLYLCVGIRVCDGLLSAATGFSSTIAGAAARVYGNVDYAAAIIGMEGAVGQGLSYDLNTRFDNLAQIGLALGLLCCTFWRPLASLNPFRPYRPALLLLALAAVLMSGFRSQLTRFAFIFIAGTLVRRKPQDLLFAAGMASLILAIVLVGGLGSSLPRAAQRALSFLPIGASEEVKHEGLESSQWRFKMWRLALTTDRYIKNKLLGDGFGFTAAEFRLNTSSKVYLTEDEQMDFFMSKGSYHGFHVETIRFVGAAGLLVATCMLFVCAAKAWRLIRYFEGRPGWSALLFLCVPYLIEPIHYWFVFGSYRGMFLLYLLGAGMLKVLDNIRVQELAAQPAEPTAQLAATGRERWVPMAVRQRAATGL